MKNARYYKLLFLVAGLWNLLAAIPCWLGGVIMPDFTFGLFGMPAPSSLFYFHALFGLIIIFGIGYFMVSRDITKNHGLIFIGLLGKILFFIDCTVAVILKEADIMLLLAGTVDMIFAVLFIEFLLSARKTAIKSAS